MGRDGEKQGWRVSRSYVERFGGEQVDAGTLLTLDHSDGRFTNMALLDRDCGGGHLELERGQAWAEVEDVGGDGFSFDIQALNAWLERAEDIALAMNDGEAVAIEAGGAFRPPHGIEIFPPCWERWTSTNIDEEGDEDDDEDAVFEWSVFLLGPDGRPEPFRKGSTSSAGKRRNGNPYDLYWNERDRIEPLIYADEKAAEAEIIRRNAELFSK